MIEFQHVSKRFGPWVAVDDLSLTVGPGEFCVLVGTSGSGKSTTLRMVNRLIEPSAGSIRVAGIPVDRRRPEDLRRHIGYAIQSVGLFPHWTVERNIATVPELLGWPRGRIRDRVTELLDLLRLDPDQVRHKFPHQLSGGQQQRVGVARALAADPAVLLMDEPFGALDPLTRAALQDELARIHHQTGKTILFVTHDMDEALKLGSRIAVMDHGRLLQAGTPRAILTCPANDFVRDFVGSDELGLKLLSIETAETRVRRGEGCDGEPVAASTPLHRALSLMIARGVDRLGVVDPAGVPLGALHLADFALARQ
ncbi:MAG TPA: ABC transporter ATP-binding protein [Azospirillaceae bacterium]|nr:ABC transporter ATP-binding protein [Azospirillaceae bacterium]